jgi:hypothetical protein
MSEEVSEVIEDSTPVEEAISDVESNEEVVLEEGQSEVEETEEVAEPAEETLYSITVNGEQLEVTMEQMQELAQKGKASAHKFQEAARLRKEAAAEKEAIQKALQGSPEDLFRLKKQAGLMSDDEIRNWIIQEALKIAEEPELSPEELKMQEMQAELDRLKNKEKEEMEAKEQAELNAQVEQYKEEYAQKILSAIENNGLDSDPYAVRMVALAIQDSADENGVPMMDIDDAIEYYKDQERSTFNNFLSNLEIDRIEKLLGEEKISKLRQKDLAKIKNPEAKPVNPFKSEKSEKKQELISATEFFKNL